MNQMTQDMVTLEKLQQETFGYFLYETNPDNGLVIDKTAPDWPSSIAATGLALACYILMIENYRSDFLWKLMKQCPYLVTGLRRAGFNNGWLKSLF